MKEQLLSILETSKAYTLAVADAMPEKNYSFRPTDSVWNFGELLHHIAYGIEWWESNYVKGTKTDWAPPAPSVKKKAITGLLQSAYQSLQQTINEAQLTGNEVAGLHATMDHITHHRGQAVIYLRCQGIEPPEYRY